LSIDIATHLHNLTGFGAVTLDLHIGNGILAIPIESETSFLIGIYTYFQAILSLPHKKCIFRLFLSFSAIVLCFDTQLRVFHEESSQDVIQRIVSFIR
jgi:hypothetical protein